jgi:hypothetical protein
MALHAAAFWIGVWAGGGVENIFTSRWTIAAMLVRVFADPFKLFLLHPEEEDIYGYTLESRGRA